MRRHIALSLLGILALVVASADLGYAAPKKGKKKPGQRAPQFVNVESDGYYVSIGRNQVFCFNETNPGMTKSTNDGRTRYDSLSSLVAKARRSGNSRKIDKFSNLLKKGRRQCRVRPSTSLTKYRGPFGYEQAARLARVSGFGAPPAYVNALVGMGMEAAVDSIINSNISEPQLAAEMVELQCDTYFATDEENEACDAQDENDLNMDGMRTAFLHYALRTNNQLQAKLQLFLNDYVAASFRVLQGCQRYAARRHAAMLAEFAQTGDLVTFLHNISNDVLMAQWLNRFSSTRLNPNEDWGREFLELFTIGKFDLDGNPRYSDAEIIASSLAFTGLRSVENRVGDYRSCYLAFAPDLHDPSPKTLWAGAPFQAVVYNGSDMVNAVRNHPGLAEYWALNLWKEFVNGSPTKSSIVEAAQILRNRNYNIKELLRVYFKSQAFYAPDSQRTIYKLPIEYVLDIVRTSGLPAPHPRELNWITSDLGQSMYNPPTVFGWYTYADNYMGGRYVLARRNIAMRLLDRSADSLMEDYGFDFAASILPDAPLSDTLINRFSSQFGVSLVDAQRAQLNEMMNYSINWQGNLVRDAFDPVNGSDNFDWKTVQLMLALVEQPEFSVK